MVENINKYNKGKTKNNDFQGTFIYTSDVLFSVKQVTQLNGVGKVLESRTCVSWVK